MSLSRRQRYKKRQDVNRANAVINQLIAFFNQQIAPLEERRLALLAQRAEIDRELNELRLDIGAISQQKYHALKPYIEGRDALLAELAASDNEGDNVA